MILDLNGKSITTINVKHVQISKQTVVCPGIELNEQSPETLKKFCDLGDTTGARESAVDSIITRMRSG